MRVRPDPQIVDGPAVLRQLLGKVPHGCKEDGDACFMAPYMGGLSRRLDHQYLVKTRIETGQRWVFKPKLIAENKDQVTQDPPPKLSSPKQRTTLWH